VARASLPFDLRHLVDIPRRERRILVRGRMLDVAVDADGAAVDDAPHARPGGGLDQLSDRRPVDLVIDAVWKARLPVQRGDVVDAVDSGDRGGERRRLAQVAVDDPDAVALELVRLP